MGRGGGVSIAVPPPALPQASGSPPSTSPGTGSSPPPRGASDIRHLVAESADPTISESWSPCLLLVSLPLLFLIYWYFSRRWTKSVKRSRKQSTYRCHYPENAVDFSDVESGI